MPGRDALRQKKKALLVRLGTTSLRVVHRDHVGHFDSIRIVASMFGQTFRSTRVPWLIHCLRACERDCSIHRPRTYRTDSGVTFRVSETSACHSLVTTHSGVLEN